VLLDILVESFEILGELVEIEDLHYFRERELFAK
jgi:hypothetical protein